MEAVLKQVIDSQNNTIQIELGNFPIWVKKKPTCWVAYSPQFKLLGFSEVSEKEAIADLRVSFDLFFNVHVERGSLEEALIDFGWKKKSDVYSKPKYFNHPNIAIGGRQRELAYA